jgi:membrane associated rhomboid family serine protease
VNKQTFRQFPVTTIYVATTLIILLLAQVNISWVSPLVLFPLLWRLAPWTLFTYGLVHIQIFHWLLNMSVIVFLGRYLEQYLGSIRYFILLTGGILAGGVLFAYINTAPAVGISAGGFALIFFFGLKYPYRPELFLRLQNWQFLLLLTTVSILSIWLGWLPGIAHDAHLAGALVGVVGYRLFDRT